MSRPDKFPCIPQASSNLQEPRLQGPWKPQAQAAVSQAAAVLQHGSIRLRHIMGFQSIIPITCRRLNALHVVAGQQQFAKATAAAQVVRPNPKLKPLSPRLLQFFQERGISPEVLSRNGIMQDAGPFARQSDPVAAFPYRRGGDIVNVKYRSLSKRFRQEKQAEKVLYGLDDVANAAEVIIVEGEMDKLALDQAGVRNVVSASLCA